MNHSIESTEHNRASGRTVVSALTLCVFAALPLGCGARSELRGPCVVAPAITRPRVVVMLSTELQVALEIRLSSARTDWPWEQNSTTMTILNLVPFQLERERDRATFAFHSIQPHPWVLNRPPTPVDPAWCETSQSLVLPFGSFTAQSWSNIWRPLFDTTLTRASTLVPMTAALDVLEREVPAMNGTSGPRLVMLLANTMGNCNPNANGQSCITPASTNRGACTTTVDRFFTPGPVQSPLCCAVPDEVEARVRALRANGFTIVPISTRHPDEREEVSYMLYAQQALARDWQHLARIAEIGGAPRRAPDGRLFYASRMGEREEFDAAFSKSIDRVSRCTRVIPAGFDRSAAWRLHVGGSAFVSSDGSPDWGYASWATDLIELYGEACERAIAEPDSVLLVADAQRCPV